MFESGELEGEELREPIFEAECCPTVGIGDGMDWQLDGAVSL
jgi:hypothetical protein